jgi:hypothetical protein
MSAAARQDTSAARQAPEPVAQKDEAEDEDFVVCFFAS